MTQSLHFWENSEGGEPSTHRNRWGPRLHEKIYSASALVLLLLIPQLLQLQFYSNSSLPLSTPKKPSKTPRKSAEKKENPIEVVDAVLE